MKTVAVIGAGASGLTAIKCCLDEGLEPTCFERTDDIGGLWNYTEAVRDDQACVMKSTVINTSKEMMCYSDFPIPQEFPIYMHNTYVQKYFRLYAEKFNLTNYIKFSTQVIDVSQTSDFSVSGQWDITFRNKSSNHSEKVTFDAVLVCTGHHASKHVPVFPGQEDFKGRIIHTHDYRNMTGFEGKKVVIVGIGNSGGDIAVELSRIASQGDVSLPSKEHMWQDVRKKQMAMAKQFVASQRHTIQVDYVGFMDELAKLNGCKPNLGKLLVTDPLLAIKCFTGPCTPYQFRLEGPGKWKEAREAIFSQWDRTLIALKTRPLGFTKNRDEKINHLLIVLVVVIVCLAIYLMKWI